MKRTKAEGREREPEGKEKKRCETGDDIHRERGKELLLFLYIWMGDGNSSFIHSRMGWQRKQDMGIMEDARVLELG